MVVYTCISCSLETWTLIVDNIFFFFDQISQRVFELIRNVSSCEALLPEGIENVSPSKSEASKNTVSGKDHKSKSVPFEMYKTRTTVVVRRETFLDVVCDALAEYKYVGPNQRADLVLACRYEVLYLLEIIISHTHTHCILKGRL